MNKTTEEKQEKLRKMLGMELFDLFPPLKNTQTLTLMIGAIGWTAKNRQITNKNFTKRFRNNPEGYSREATQRSLQSEMR